MVLNRNTLVESARQESPEWDIIVIGGGATGLGTALDSVTRGYRTLLLEQSDFAKGTSSRSTKLVHGGVRYLRQGNISLVREALKERGLLIQNAPHLVRRQAFIIPGYKWWEKPFYSLGMKIYDRMAGKLGFGASGTLDTHQALKEIPSLNPENLRGGVCYFDGQFDDSRLAIDLMKSIHDHGGIAINYLKVTGFLKENGLIRGVTALDQISGESRQFRCKAVVNATGVFTDSVRELDDRESRAMIRASQGVHIVLDRSFMPGDNALMIPKTDDGRVLFAIPWHNRLIVGTTDTLVDSIDLEPRALAEELEYLLSHTGRYLASRPEPDDVKSVFTGLRPLVRSDDDKSTKKISRDHTILIDQSGLVTVTGGKWTTYRKMAEDTVDTAAEVGELPPRPSVTRDLKIHGSHETPVDSGESIDENPYYLYGSDAPKVRQIEQEQPGWDKPIHPSLEIRPAEIIWAVRYELACCIEDVLSRRTRALLLDAKASVEIAAKTATLIAEERKFSVEWIDQQVSDFKKIAANYRIDSYM